MYRMKKWYLETTPKGFKCHGICYGDGNPGFFSGESVTISHIMRIEAEDEEKQLKLFTQSGSCCILEYADINDVTIEPTQKVLNSMDIVVDLQRCVALKEERVKATKKKVADLLNHNELYVVMIGGERIIEAYLKRKDDAVVPISVNVHTGMFQDSIIVADWVAGLCDWRIFQGISAVKPYHWSDNLEAVHIENVGKNFMFEGSNGEILCESGVITLIKNKEYKGEGLISPDAVNGKCAFSARDVDDLIDKE